MYVVRSAERDINTNMVTVVFVPEPGTDRPVITKHWEIGDGIDTEEVASNAFVGANLHSGINANDFHYSAESSSAEAVFLDQDGNTATMSWDDIYQYQMDCEIEDWITELPEDSDLIEELEERAMAPRER